ncbi:MAG: hypothetical protein U1G07_00025 [Verrucomicrobiota bacterium]
MLGLCAAGAERLGQIKRFDMPGFRPRGDWIREMVRYGVLPPSSPDVLAQASDPYRIEQRYWQSLWYSPRP